MKALSKTKTASRVEEQMTGYPAIGSPEMTADEAIQLMEAKGIRHLPVVEAGEVVGVVSDRDLRQAGLVPELARLTVSDLMTRRPYCVDTGTPLSEVAAVMARRKYGCAVVLGPFGRVVGVFTTTDGMRVLSHILSEKTSPHEYRAGIRNFLPRTHMIER